MGKSETSTVSVGIKIRFSDLLSQITDTNFNLVKKMLYSGCVEDENEYYNEVYRSIIRHVKDIEPQEEFIKYLSTEFANKGSLSKDKFNSEITQDLSCGCLLDRDLLVPIKEILSTTRWGYDRNGVNSKSKAMSTNLLKYKNDYDEIKGKKIVIYIDQQRW